MKNLRMLVCLVGGATLFGMGCGGEPLETPGELEQQPTSEESSSEPGRVQQQTVYSVCWSELGVYEGPSTGTSLTGLLKYGNHFNTDSSVFWSNGEYWVRGGLYCYPPYNCYGGYGYVRWGGLC
ncbi:hypothetical protein [Corallococcus llansteffanensis]|uniref:Uncharacterized protein n=1 Tax=Corallococcus llansteffanensis TaxID=2316731 RepID=A0A3A8QGH5_9BACT|nr:hypothetical protein [Corallococcus llansteffanensis]RKH66771.1 hypothetical protein D7V93_03915 [Corallococcus llansteffanensis]